MSKIVIDGREIDAPAEYTLLQARELAGAEAPRFCFHERLSVAGNCRMRLDRDRAARGAERQRRREFADPRRQLADRLSAGDARGIDDCVTLMAAE